MKKLILILGGAGVILFGIISFNKDKNSLQDPPAVSGEHQPVTAVESVMNKPVESSDNAVAIAPESPSLDAKKPGPAELEFQPHEIRVIMEWSEARGYDADGSFTLGYDSMGQEALIALANQHDPKAHLVLANRVLKKPDGQRVSREQLEKAEPHLYAASMLGYTSTLNQLSDLKQRISIGNVKARQELIAEAYTFAYVSELRGDIGASTHLDGLRFSNPISENEKKSILIKADNMLRELSLQRSALGLPEFDNTTPPELQVYAQMGKDQAAEIGHAFEQSLK